jgi:ADP-dependent phosphofructokinase/glucokinase
MQKGTEMNQNNESPTIKTIFVSYDCGIQYQPYMTSSDINELVEKGKEFDEQMLRWYIEDPDGNMDCEHLSGIHRSIVNTMRLLNGEEIDGD